MNQQSHILALRLFGAGQAQVEQELRRAAQQGCPGLQLLAREDELIVCVRAKAESQAQAQQICDEWEARFRKAFGPAVYGKDGEDLTQAALQTMADRKKLFVAADRVTGRLLQPRLQEQELAAAVYDFGSQSYEHPTKAEKIRPSAALLKKYPHCPVQPLASRAREALKLSKADYAAAYSPSQPGQPAFVLVCDAKKVWLRTLPETAQPNALAAAWILDLLRRLAGGLSMAEGVLSFAHGQECPPLVLAQPRPQVQPKRTAQPAEALDGFLPIQDAAQLLFDAQAQLPTDQLAQKPKKRGWARVAGSVAAVLSVAILAASVWHIRYSSGGSPLEGMGYGTADFDAAARSSLTQAQGQGSQAAAYLALPQLGGTLVYRAGAVPQTAADGRVYAAEAQQEAAQFTASVDPAAPHANPIVVCPRQSIPGLDGLSDQELLSQNSGFTLYTNEQTYRYKVAAVYYWDPAETGATAFDLYELEDLSNYQDFLTFVLGSKARSLYEMPVDLQDDDRFATLVADMEDGTKLVILGRMQRSDETAVLQPKQIQPADQPLLPMAMYKAADQQAPSVETLNQYWMNWYLTSGATSSDVQQESGMPQEDQLVEGEFLTPENQENQQPESSASPEPSSSAASSSSEKPGTSASPKPTATGTGTPSPQQTEAPTRQPAGNATQAPTQQATQAPVQTQAPTPAPTQAPTPAPTAAPSSGKTITVTMNGVRQEMDLVECLAMIARAEMGAGAPVEAYKAQIIAAHSWILSQGGAPSVVGREPNSTIRQAAQEVADLVVTYNGRVAFTPYFASAAFGTNASEDVWGSSRPYLVAVDSPYDQTYATNWQNTRVFTVEEVAQRASERLGQDLYAYSDDPSTWMGDLVKNSSGYVTSMRVGNVTISGSKLQENVLAGFSGRPIRSAAFDITYSDGAFSITTYGYGHGCGMSQFGAWGYAANGWSYQQILAHYYPGTSLSAVG